MAALVDTNILVYRHDPRHSEKRRVAIDLLSTGLNQQSLAISHQAIIEFVAATTKPLLAGRPILARHDACREAEELLSEFDVLYPMLSPIASAIASAACFGGKPADSNRPTPASPRCRWR